MILETVLWLRRPAAADVFPVREDPSPKARSVRERGQPSSTARPAGSAPSGDRPRGPCAQNFDAVGACGRSTVHAGSPIDARAICGGTPINGLVAQQALVRDRRSSC